MLRSTVVVHPETGQLLFKVHFKACIDPQEQHLGPEGGGGETDSVTLNSTCLVSRDCNEDNLERAQYGITVHENSGKRYRSYVVHCIIQKDKFESLEVIE